ncbi:MAG: SDR family oxidoreductase [Acidimicrobiia bacterium]|nr:SDR family oxidoreductase [Acidimicrobiia bacterium]
MDVRGANVLVTGASSGIGAALAELLAERGATVGIVARRAEQLGEVLQRCRRHSPGSRSWVVDLADVEAAEEVVSDAWDSLGHLDVVVNNAATSKRKHLEDMTYGEYEDVMGLNFLSPVRIALAALARMRERGRGEIVMISSTGGRLGIVHESAYCAAKGAMCLWAEAAAIDLGEADSPLRVKLVNPGPIDTEIWQVRPGELPGAFAGPFVPASDCAAGIVDAIEADGFEFYVPDDMRVVADGKAADVDGFVAAMITVAKATFPR